MSPKPPAELRDDDGATPEPAAAVATESKPQPRPRKRGRGGLIAGLTIFGILALAGVGYVVAYAAAGDKTPKNASVEGVAIGGLTTEQAEAELQKAMAPKVDAPITVEGNDKKVDLVPSKIGMSIDYKQTVQAAGAGRSWNPAHIIRVLTGGTELKAITKVDPAAVTTAVDNAAPTWNVEPKNAGVKVADLKPVLTPGNEGFSLDVPATSKLVLDAWRKTTKVQATIKTHEPAISNAAAQKVVDEQLQPLLSGPVTVKTDIGKNLTVDVATIAAATTVKTEADKITVATDMNKIWEGAQDGIALLKLTKATDAKVGWGSGGNVVVTPSTDGQKVEKDVFLKAVQPALTATGAARTVSIKITKTPAEYTTQMANNAGIKEVIGEFTTHWTFEPYRNQNIGAAARSINGTFVKPGGVFSLNQTLGQRTVAKGYTEGWAIIDGRMVKVVGGGVSLTATTTFNAAFFAGMTDITHQPHTLYFARYPAGREATVSWPDLDMKFGNDTKYGVLMQAFITPATATERGSMTVKIWSTKSYTKVASSELVRSNYKEGTTVTVTSKPCTPQGKLPGFDVNYSRLFYQGSNLVKTEKFFWRYSPQDEVVCK